MLAKAVPGVPAPDSVAGGLAYEPKWDGFRAIVYRDGDEVEIGSRNTKSIARYFPEVVASALAFLPNRCVLDGEIVIATGGTLAFTFFGVVLGPPVFGAISSLFGSYRAGYTALAIPLAVCGLMLLRARRMEVTQIAN